MDQDPVANVRMTASEWMAWQAWRQQQEERTIEVDAGHAIAQVSAGDGAGAGGVGGAGGSGSAGQPMSQPRVSRSAVNEQEETGDSDSTRFTPMLVVGAQMEYMNRLVAVQEKQIQLQEKVMSDKKYNDLKPSLFPAFDGHNPLEVFTWIQSIETLFTAADAADLLNTPRSVAKVAVAIKMPARSWFNMNAAKLLQLNWYGFKAELVKKFGLMEKDTVASSSLLELCSKENSDYDLYTNQFNLLVNMMTVDDPVLTNFEYTMLFQAYKRGMPQCLTPIANLYKGKDVEALQAHLVYYMSRDADLARRAGYRTGCSGVIPTPMELGLASRQPVAAHNVHTTPAYDINTEVDESLLPLDPLEMQGYQWDGSAYYDGAGAVYNSESELLVVGATFRRGASRFNRQNRYRSLGGRARGGRSNRGRRTPMDWQPSGPQFQQPSGPQQGRSQQGGRGQGRRGGGRFSGTCHACGNRGHMAKDCEAVRRGLISFNRGGRGGRGRGRSYRQYHVEQDQYEEDYNDSYAVNNTSAVTFSDHAAQTHSEQPAQSFQ